MFEDNWLLVVDKPSGMPVHAAAGSSGPDLLTLARATRPYTGLLHRLDREASGLLLLSKDPAVNPALQRQLERHEVARTYLAILAGRVRFDERTVDRPIAERAQGRAALLRRPPPSAAPARSHFRMLRALGNRATLVEIHLETGRKHQIRVHAAAIHHPIVGDRRYGGPPESRLALHATRLQFIHPKDNRPLELEAPLPRALEEMCERMST